MPMTSQKHQLQYQMTPINIRTTQKEQEWVQDDTMHPAPPGDLNSPLIV